MLLYLQNESVRWLSWRWPPKKVFMCVFLKHQAPFFLIKQHWAPFLPRLSWILPRFSRSFDKSKFWECACTPCITASYTTVWLIPTDTSQASSDALQKCSWFIFWISFSQKENVIWWSRCIWSKRLNNTSKVITNQIFLLYTFWYPKKCEVLCQTIFTIFHLSNEAFSHADEWNEKWNLKVLYW